MDLDPDTILPPDILDRAVRARDALNEATDRLNEALGRAERALVERYKGKAAAIEYDSKRALMFWRKGARWGLYVVDEHGNSVPLLNASRDTRIETAALLPDLHIQLEEGDGT
jgi:hypothetical protein